MSASRATRVLAVSSGGGHWMQLRRLRSAFEGFDVTWVTVDRGYAAELGSEPLRVVTDATLWDRWKLARLALEVLWLVARERPDVVVTTGAAPGFFAVVFGKLFGARTAWIDSIANGDQLSGSGARVRRFADVWLTQWPHLAGEDGPRYEGAVL